MTRTTCGLKAPSMGSGIKVAGAESLGGIPESLVVYGAVSTLSVLLYLVVRRTKCSRTCRIGGSSPSFFDLLRGKEDQWIETERGIGALHYILFQRSVALFTFLLLAISVTSLAINLSQEDEGKIFLHRTASSNLPKGDPKFWFHVVSTFLIPWVAFVLLQRLRRLVGKLKPGACQFGKTLMLQPLKMEEEELRSHFAANFKHSSLKSINYGYSTQMVIQCTLSCIDFHTRVLEVLLLRGEETPAWWQHILAGRISRGVEFHSLKLLSFKAGRDEAKAATLAGQPCLLFLTFSSHEEAAQVKSEISKRPISCIKSLCCNQVSFAPLPSEVLWNNLRPRKKKVAGMVVSYLLLIFLVLLCSTPAGFQRQFASVFGEGAWLQDAAFLLPPLLILLFGFLVPFAVKLITVTYGSPARPQSTSSYMSTLYFWLLCSTLIFPIIIEGASNLLDLSKELEAGGLDLWVEKWQCVFAIDTGMFYISLLIVVAGLKNMLQLHRTGDWFGELFDVMRNCRSPAEVIVARERARETAKNRSGNKLALADDYVWLVLYTTIHLFFLSSCPLITAIFTLYLGSKHLVDMVNWKEYYHAKPDQPELLVTAAKLLLFASLFPQFNTTFFLLARGPEDWNNGTFYTALALLLVNSLALILYKIFSYCYPVPLFDYRSAGVESAKVEYIDPLLELESMTVEELAALKGLKARTGGLLSAVQLEAWFKQGGNRGLVSAVHVACT